MKKTLSEIMSALKVAGVDLETLIAINAAVHYVAKASPVEAGTLSVRECQRLVKEDENGLRPSGVNDPADESNKTSMKEQTKQWVVAVDFVATEDDAQRIAIALATAACKAAEDAGGREVVSQPYMWIQDVPPND